MNHPKNTQEAIQQVLELTSQAWETFRPTIGLRHYVLGVGGSGTGKSDDLYWLILRAESALRELQAAAEQVKERQSPQAPHVPIESR